MSDLTIAAIDIGTNSAHLVIAKTSAGDRMTILDTDKINLRLGDEIDKAGRLSQEAITRTLAALQRMQEIATSHSPQFRVVATHATRVATNHQELIDRAASELGLTIDLIDGLEEARLVALGINYGLPVRDRSFLGMDIGGGSTEWVACDHEVVRFAATLPLGCVVLTRRFFGDDKPRKSDIRALDEHLEMNLGPVVADLQAFPREVAIACSGTAKTLAGMIAEESRGMDPQDLSGFQIEADEVFALHERLVRLRATDKIRSEWHLDSNRASIILAGSAIFAATTRLLGIESWTIATTGLREGLLLDTINRVRSKESLPMSDVRWQSITRLGGRLQIDNEQARRVTRVAAQLFQSLSPILPEGPATSWGGLSDLDLLRAAAWLHECGKFIGFPKFHRHSLYLIVNSPLLGFTRKEKLMIGLIARYQRKGEAHAEEWEPEGLSEEEVRKINLLAGVIRVSAAAHRSRRGDIATAGFSGPPDALTLHLESPDGGGLAEADRLRVEKEKRFLAKQLDTTITLAAS